MNKKQKAMPVNEFEKQVQQKMDELKLTPSTGVWTEVEKRIREEKKRRRLIFWWLLPALLVGGGAVYFINNNNQRETNTLAQTENTISTTSTQPLNPSTFKPLNDSSSQPLNFSTPQPLNPSTSQQLNIDIFNGSTKKKTSSPKEKEEVITSVNEDVQDMSITIGKPEKKENIPFQQRATENTLSNKPTSELLNPSTPQPVVEEKQPEVTAPGKTGTTQNESATHAKKKSNWDIGFGITAGSSNTHWGNLFGGAQSFYDAYSTTPGSGQSSGGPPVYIQAPQKGFSWSAEVFVQRKLSNRLDLRTGLHYHYLSSRMKTGDRVNSQRLISNQLSNRLVDDFYRPVTSSVVQHNYTNKYHFAGATVGLSWKIINGRKFNIAWDNNIAVSRLLSTNALHYDSNQQVFYEDFTAFRKTQFFITTGLSVPVLKKEKINLAINPFLSYGLQPVVKKSNGPDAHFINYGVGLKFLLPHKK